MYFEFVFGRVTIRWRDKEVEHGATDKPLRKVVRHRLKLVQTCRDRWPVFAAYAEDAKFWREKWNEEYNPTDGPRPIFHDCTNIPLVMPADADLQRSLWSDYYSMPCAKGGVANQCCSWIRGLPLCSGHIGDSELIMETGILQIQKDFAAGDPSSQKPFLNILDKGYRIALEASVQGGQQVLQPAFSRGDQQFRRAETLHSAGVAVHRSGNERAVKRCKLSWLFEAWNTRSNVGHRVSM